MAKKPKIILNNSYNEHGKRQWDFTIEWSNGNWISGGWYETKVRARVSAERTIRGLK